MARSKNIQEHDRILKIAFRAFKEKGYGNTTYQDIADTANARKSLVQYYFPKKEVFLKLFLEKSLDSISEIIQNSKYYSENAFENLYMIGYFQFLYLIYNEDMEILKYDVFSSRESTKTIISIVINWVLKYVHINNRDEMTEISDAITISMGGAFEYVYMCLSNSKPLNPKYISDKIVLVMNTVLGIPSPNISIHDIFDDEWLNQKINQLNNTIFEN